MVEGTYNVMLKTPMGVKKGELVLIPEGDVLNGKLVVMGQENPIEPGKTDGTKFSFSGELKTAVGKMSYECAGNVEGDAITGSVKTKKGTLTLTGKRK